MLELQPGGLSSVSLSFAAATSTDSNLDLNHDVASIALRPAGSSDASNSSDGPMPPWALGALGAGLLGVARARLARVI